MEASYLVVATVPGTVEADIKVQYLVPGMVPVLHWSSLERSQVKLWVSLTTIYPLSQRLFTTVVALEWTQALPSLYAAASIV